MSRIVIGGLVLAAGAALLASASAGDRVVDRACLGVDPTIVGTAGDDRLAGTSGADVIDGLGGDDIVKSESGNDAVCGRDGLDQVLAGAGADDVSGGKGHDRLFGGPGPDVLTGREQVDLVTGEKGDGDVCRGGSPSPDTLRSGDLSDHKTCETHRNAYHYGSFSFPDGKIER